MMSYSRCSLGVVCLVVFMVACSDQLKNKQTLRPEMYFADSHAISLCRAIQKGESSVGSLLTETDLNQEGTNNMTFLVWALKCENEVAYKALLKAGADPNLRLQSGSSVMHYAAAFKNSSFLEMALEYGGDADFYSAESDTTTLEEAILHDRDKNIEILLEHGANINSSGAREGMSPLMTAASLNRYDLVYDFLLRGASFDHKTRAGDTIIDLLRDDLKNPNLFRTGELFEAKSQVIDLLESNGVDVAELRVLYRTTPQ